MIIAMKKATLVALKEDKDSLIISLQRYGELMLITPHAEVRSDTDSSEEEALLQRTEKSLQLIKKFKAKNKGFAKQTEVEYSEFSAADPKAENFMKAIENADEEIAAHKQELITLQDKIKYFQPWEKLMMKLSDISSVKEAVIRTGTIEMRNLEPMTSLVASFGGEMEVFDKSDSGIAMLYACYQLDDPLLFEQAKILGFNQVNLPSNHQTVTQILVSLHEETQMALDQIVILETKLTEYASKSESIELYADQAASAIQRKKAETQETIDTVVIEGWVRSDKLKRFEKAINDVTDIYDLEYMDPIEGELPPTVTKNNKFVDAFESITDMFSKPNPYEVDPNPVMSVWYWIIFGMMMGDAGYGLVMVLGVGLFLKKMKPKGNSARLFRVIYYSGYSTMIWGILFGSYFGFTWNPIVLEPMVQPMEFLFLSIGLGVCHIITGLLVKAYRNLRDHHYLAILADSFSWIMILIGIGMLLLPATAEIGKWIALSGTAIIVLFAGRAIKNPVGRVGLGLYTLYGITSYLGDILSYSRILALSLSSAVLGMVMNMLAGMVQGSIIGAFFSIFIYLIGHIFNLAMGLLSAYVHASRLQYIEFFGKFYEGGGTAFRPLAIDLKHIDTVNDTIE
jgi:V/A-type H+/Na+-transporting ATPase subunit I